MQETKRKTEDAVRINKYLSQAGICSRRQADTYVEEGRVEVDGEVAVSGTKVLPGQSVTFDGKPVKIQENLIFLAFHKPRGIVCTASKEEKDNIIDYINYPTRIYPVGRLDKDSQGLILLTNDGEAANQIIAKAKENDVPFYKDNKLAETLSKLEIGDAIPPELYEVVAEILVFVDDMDKMKAKLQQADMLS